MDVCLDDICVSNNKGVIEIMKITARFVFVGTLIIWTLMLLPYFVPVLNTLVPTIFGLPFIVIWQYTLIGLHMFLALFAAKRIWDPFDKNVQNSPHSCKGGDKA